jgi:hypothetical protein
VKTKETKCDTLQMVLVGRRLGAKTQARVLDSQKIVVEIEAEM